MLPERKSQTIKIINPSRVQFVKGLTVLFPSPFSVHAVRAGVDSYRFVYLSTCSKGIVKNPHAFMLNVCNTTSYTFEVIEYPVIRNRFSFEKDA